MDHITATTFYLSTQKVGMTRDSFHIKIWSCSTGRITSTYWKAKTDTGKIDVYNCLHVWTRLQDNALRLPMPKDRRQLVVRMQQEWSNHNVNELMNLCDSFGRHILECIDSKGRHTHYQFQNKNPYYVYIINKFTFLSYVCRFPCYNKKFVGRNFWATLYYSTIQYIGLLCLRAQELEISGSFSIPNNNKSIINQLLDDGVPFRIFNFLRGNFGLERKECYFLHI